MREGERQTNRSRVSVSQNLLPLTLHRASRLTMVTGRVPCDEHKVDPFAYLRDVIARISTYSARAISELFHGNWKAKE